MARSSERRQTADATFAGLKAFVPEQATVVASQAVRTARVRLGPPVRWTLSALHGISRGKHVSKLQPGEPVTIQSRDDLALSGLLYRAKGDRTPGLVIVHGWDPLGQRHGYYVALARAMQARGYTVLTFNLRGYPGSDRPPAPDGFNLMALAGDVESALVYLAARDWVAADHVTLFGHSYGAGLVLPLVRHNRARLWRAVVHGPSVWVEERITGPAGRQRAFFHERYWRYMSLPEPIPEEIYLRLKQDLYLLEQIKTMPQKHPPLLLLDGGAEGEETWSFLRELYARIPSPCSYYSIPSADHFCNTAALGPWLIEDRTTINLLADYLDAWLYQGEAPRR